MSPKKGFSLWNSVCLICYVTMIQLYVNVFFYLVAAFLPLLCFPERLLCVDFVSALLSSGTRARFRGMRAEVEQQLACFVTASGPQSLTAD